MKYLFNLQLFAELNTNVTTANTPGNDLSPTMKEYYDTELLENARADLYFNQFGMEQPLPKNNGDTVEWRKFDTFKKAMSPLTEGVTPDGQKVSMTKIKQSIDQFGAYTVISDRLELEAVDPILMGVTEESGAQAGETIDCVTRNELMTGTHVMYAGGKTSRSALTAADKITPTDINKAVTHLKKMKAPKINGKYVAIIHPSVAEDLRESDAWIDVHKYSATTEIFNGEIGELHGVRFVETTEQKVFKGETISATITASKGNVVTVTTDAEPGTLAGRLVSIGSTKYIVTKHKDNELTLIDYITMTAPASVPSSGAISDAEGGASGAAVYATLFLGKDAYGIIKPTAESMQMIIKQRGSAGTADPLDQRSSVGWKCSHAAKILYEERILRYESGSSYSAVDEGN